VQIEVDSEHAKRYISGLNRTVRSVRKYVKFGGREAQNQVFSMVFSMLFIWFVYGVGGLPD
jgi:uncharacterized protein YneR